jgi:hypothetical protein
VLAQKIMRQQLDSATMLQRAGWAVFAGHRNSWIQALNDGAGDGYFYDPERTDVEGAFFYHFAEDGSYTWFPSLRNFLSGLIECYQTKSITLEKDGKNLKEDVSRTQAIWQSVAKSSDRDR